MLVIYQSIFWSILGVIIYRQKLIKVDVGKLLGRSLYWFGVPLQIFFLVLKSNFDRIAWLPTIVSITVLLIGFGLSLLALYIFRQPAALAPDKKEQSTLTLPVTYRGKGSFILASILGNTGFIGLALIPSLVSSDYWIWIALYSLSHNILGSYGLGALVANHYSSSKNSWFKDFKRLFLLPSLWAFAFGVLCRSVAFPKIIELIIAKSILCVVPAAFVLIGMRLSTLQHWQDLRAGVIPTVFKILILPSLTAFLLTCFGVQGESRLVLVLMSGMPTAFASVILAEAYNLERNIAASSILLSTLSMPLVLFVWLNIL